VNQRFFLHLGSVIALVFVPSILHAQEATPDREGDSSPLSIFAREKLVAWCIVPFDGKKRGPAERAEMLKRLGLQRVAYDWRQEHVVTFEQEILEYKKHGIEYFAFWDTHEEAFKLFEKYGLHPQIWKMLPAPAGETHQQKVEDAAKKMLPIVERTRKLGSKLGLYNHGGWGGEPENMVAVCKHLREHHDAKHVGIVYNQHHAHGRIDDFAKIVALMKPYLLCLNLNGMTRDGDQQGRKILPLGEGELDVKLLKLIRASGYEGPLGIIGHTQDDVEQRLQDNLDGLDWILPQLEGKPAGPKPKLRTWSPAKVAPADGNVPGVLLEGRNAFRQPPITVECRVTLPRRDQYNILVASDTKQSGAHWEIFSVRGSGMFTAYLPGMNPDHLHTQAMICDNKPHTVAMIYEPNRVRLFVDGKRVAEQPMESKGRPAVPDGLAIGRLVKERLGCSGPVEWVRISRGVRNIPAESPVAVEKDDATLLLWRRESKTNQDEATSLSIPKEYSADLVAKLLKEAESGTPERGLMVFSSAKSACLSCHKLGHHGGDVGPKLSAIGKERKPHEIVESVLWPKRHVKPEYTAHQIVTADGVSHQGYLVKKSDQQVVLRDPTKPEAGETAIAVDEIEAQREIGTLMPANLVAAMSEEQLTDMLCFLTRLGRNDGMPPDEIDSVLAHAHAHLHGPVSFPYDRKPLHPEHWPSWEHFVNRDRLYDFYAKEADYFRQHENIPPLLPEYPGLDGGELGHWGNQNEETWASDRWNKVKVRNVQCGVFRGAGVTVPRGVCVQLGDNNELAACFNPDTLTYDAVWSGGFLKFSSVRHGFLNGVMMDGTAKPRPEGEKPSKPFKYHGFFRMNGDIIFAYRIGDKEYWDVPKVKDGKFNRELYEMDEFYPPSVFQADSEEWPDVIETRIEHGTASPYAVDTIGLPVENPWNATFFCGGQDFLPDGSALVCTMRGDVWRVEGIEYPSKTAKWRRFASGLHHPQGLVVDKDGIFVLGRDQITRLHDRDENGEADYYECFSNAYQTSAAGHDFICGLERDAEGNFYTASGNQGVVRISADGKRAEVLATGFRNPDGLGLTADGVVTVPCAEGTWTPASMVCAFRPTLNRSTTLPHFGHHGPKNGEPPALPLVYLPRGVDNSSGGQTTVNSDRWGPLKDQLLHFSFGTGSHFLLLRDEIDGQLQGAVVPLPGEFQSGVHRGRFNLSDGQLYVSGLQGWGSYTPEDGCFQRVRYTGDPVQLPIRFRVYENGVALTFSSPLDSETASQVRSHFAQCWNYRYSGAYGSPEFSTKHFGIRGHDSLKIESAHVVNEKTLFLEIPELQPVNQLHLLVQSAAGKQHELFVTVHTLAEPFAEFPGYKPAKKTINPHPILADLAMATKSVPNPFTKRIKPARRITIETGNNLSYKTRSFRVQPGEAVEFTLSNPDVVPHNWALAKPGTLRRVGEIANRLISDPEAAIRHYIPNTEDVLVYTDVVLPRGEFTIWFRAPEQQGRYPYLCTFPGHWLVMNGEMIVEEQATR
jgi:putative heme-binding domain-containing protein